MTQRRDIVMLGLGLPLLHACGGGGGNSGPVPGGEHVLSSSVTADDWPLASPASQDVAAGAMQDLLDGGAGLGAMRALLVVRNGMLIGERYYAGTQSSDLLHIRSVTKTVSSLLIGIALRDGKISSLDAPLSQLLPRELARVPGSVAASVTLRQILQMRSGLVWNEESDSDALFKAPDVTQLALNRRASGLDVWNYDSASSHLPSPILADANGIDTLALAKRDLFGPLGIKQVAWDRDASGSYYGSWGLQMRPRDMMKIAWMALEGGQWQGRSVVPPAWLQDSFVPYSYLPADNDLTRIGYGYLWWNGTLGTQRVVMAIGFGGQLAMLVPNKRLCLVTAAEWNLPYTVGSANLEWITSLLGRFIATL